MFRTAIALGLAFVLAPQASPQSTDVWPPPGVHGMREPGLTAPKLLSQIQPQYTPQALAARIEGNVQLESVVGPDGSVQSVRVKRSLDAVNGLDDEAMKAMRQWRFTPGMKDGVPVAVAITVQMSFSLAANGTAPLSLPDGFVTGGVDRQETGVSWQTTVAEDAGWRVRLSYPSDWTPRPDNRLPAVGRLHNRAVSVFEVRLQPKVTDLNQPIAAKRLQEYATALGRTMVARKAELRAWGQARLNDRFWTWVDLKLPSPSVDRDDFALWSFNTTEGDRMIQVTCYVSMPRGSAPADTEMEMRSASPVFVEMLKRLVLERAE